MIRRSLLIFIGAFFFGNSYSYSQGIDKEQAQLIANNLLISKNYKAAVEKILPAINNIQVLVLNVPYREYPSIIILNKMANRWSIVFEALAPGIQDKTSKRLDWHTKGTGVDFTFDNGQNNDFKNEK